MFESTFIVFDKAKNILNEEFDLKEQSENSSKESSSTEACFDLVLQKKYSELLSIINREYHPDDVDENRVFSSEYYLSMHDTPAYQKNNWFSDKYIKLLQAKGFKSIFELGSGNGKATKKMADIFDVVYSCDWNPNPYSSLPNVEFFNASFFDVPNNTEAEVTVSADVIEHFPPRDVPRLINKLHQISPYGLHLIAGYPDGHSHLSVFSPWRWLELFRVVDKGYNIIEIEFRRGRSEAPIFVISNF